MPKCQYLIDLLRLTGPVYQSSANISGQEPVQSVQEVFSVFKAHYDHIVIVDNVPYEMPSQQPSTIIDLDNMKLVREGEVDGQAILNQINGGSK
ncbi:MAG: Sua5/YciO/YrdC/YwlC family protein [Mycoplasmoidaceae bacterium]|nr:Sua5/YciO/YrdC/YwlC family protein [Mycoplasmoidaceae bacterium]